MGKLTPARCRVCASGMLVSDSGRQPLGPRAGGHGSTDILRFRQSSQMGDAHPSRRPRAGAGSSAPNNQTALDQRGGPSLAVLLRQEHLSTLKRGDLRLGCRRRRSDGTERQKGGGKGFCFRGLSRYNAVRLGQSCPHHPRGLATVESSPAIPRPKAEGSRDPPGLSATTGEKVRDPSLHSG